MRRLAWPVALVLAVGLVAPVAAAGQSDTDHGTITGAEFRCRDVVKTFDRDVSGIWTLNLSGAKTATVTLNVSYDGAHHTSFGASQGVVGADGMSATFWGGIATARIVGGVFTWDVSLGRECSTDPADPGYDALTYRGDVRD